MTFERTHAKETSKDQGHEEQGEADGELLLLGDGGVKGLARRGVPEILERRGRHGMAVVCVCDVR